ncbi:uncharacterized protein LOC131237899 [Magnolia sinica]|uniref:uncharacterized protein LOC131237899 n=1 Tax=Magnolia sinica TaxID=86752 RepID=UPI00265A8AC9|nr:uncharacterized protein LOC131237899 [Magnolia sinica]
MISQNEKLCSHTRMGTFFVPEVDCDSVVNPETIEICSTNLAIDASPIPSLVVSGAWSRGFLPIESQRDDESNLRCKQLKLMAPSQQCVFLSIPENSSPLGLTLRKTPSFVNLVETMLSHASIPSSECRKEGIDAGAQQTPGKSKASNFSASLLRIGSWERASRFEGELVAKCYYAKRKLVWEVLDSGLKNKIELPWSDIASLKATFNEGGPETLEIELSGQPLFFQEMNPQPRKHTLWKAAADFTGGQASTCRRHFLQFPQGTLQKHYEKLLKSDERLSLLSKKPYPTLDSPFFGHKEVGDQNLSCHQLFGIEEQSSNLLKRSFDQATTNDYSEHSQSFTISRTSPVLQQLSKLELPIAFSETASPSSVIDLSSVEERVGSPFWRATFAGAGNHMDQIASSVSIANMFPSVFGSVLPSVPDFGTSITTRHYPCMKKKTADNTRVEISDTNISVLGLDQSYSNAKLNCDGSTINPGSIFQISEIQTDWNLVFPIGSRSKVGNNSEIDGYLSYGFSFPEESSRQVSGKCSNLFENISSSVPFPLFFVEDPASTDEIGEVMGQV